MEQNGGAILVVVTALLADTPPLNAAMELAFQASRPDAEREGKRPLPRQVGRYGHAHVATEDYPQIANIALSLELGPRQHGPWMD